MNITDSELRWTTNHHNSAVLRLERAPPSMCPSPNRPRYQTCVWMDPLCMNVWTQCWGARFISSNETPRLGHHPLPLVGGARSPAARVACAREWTDDLCVLGCVRDWECVRGWVRTHAETGKRYKQHLKRNKIEKRNNEVSKGFRKEILPLKEADPQIPERKNFGYEKKKIIVITRIIFFVLNYC